MYHSPDSRDPIRGRGCSRSRNGVHVFEGDVILFVANTKGGFSLGKNYHELIDIIKSGKRLLNILNDGAGGEIMSDA